MEIVFLVNGKTDDKYLIEGIDRFEKRISRYIKYKQVVLPALKNTQNMPPEVQKNKEAEQMLPHLEKADFIVLLDENAKLYRSVEFARFIENSLNRGGKTIFFVVGGPYGFLEDIRRKAHYSLSLSPLRIVKALYSCSTNKRRISWWENVIGERL